MMFKRLASSISFVSDFIKGLLYTPDAGVPDHVTCSVKQEVSDEAKEFAYKWGNKNLLNAVHSIGEGEYRTNTPCWLTNNLQLEIDSDRWNETDKKYFQENIDEIRAEAQARKDKRRKVEESKQPMKFDVEYLKSHPNEYVYMSKPPKEEYGVAATPYNHGLIRLKDSVLVYPDVPIISMMVHNRRCVRYITDCELKICGYKPETIWASCFVPKPDQPNEPGTMRYRARLIDDSKPVARDNVEWIPAGAIQSTTAKMEPFDIGYLRDHPNVYVHMMLPPSSEYGCPERLHVPNANGTIVLYKDAPIIVNIDKMMVMYVTKSSKVIKGQSFVSLMASCFVDRPDCRCQARVIDKNKPITADNVKWIEIQT